MIGRALVGALWFWIGLGASTFGKDVDPGFASVPSHCRGEIVARQLAPKVVLGSALGVPVMPPAVPVVAEPGEELISEHVGISDMAVDPSYLVVIGRQPSPEAPNVEPDGIRFPALRQNVTVPRIDLSWREARGVRGTIASEGLVSNFEDGRWRSAAVLKPQRDERVVGGARRIGVDTLLVGANNRNEVGRFGAFKREPSYIGGLAGSFGTDSGGSIGTVQIVDLSDADTSQGKGQEGQGGREERGRVFKGLGGERLWRPYLLGALFGTAFVLIAWSLIVTMQGEADREHDKP